MCNMRSLLAFLVICCTQATWSLDFTSYDELSQDIIGLAKILEIKTGLPHSDRDFFIARVATKIKDLEQKNAGLDADLYVHLKQALKTEEGITKLAKTLSDIRKKYHTDGMASHTRIKLVNYFKSLFLGKIRLSYTGFDELSRDILALAKILEVKSGLPSSDRDYFTGRVIAKIKALELMNKPNETIDGDDFFPHLRKIISTDTGNINTQDLAQVLVALDKKFPMSAAVSSTSTAAVPQKEDAIRAKKLKFFESVVLGEKRVQNVAVIGRTRGGKSTFLATLMDPLDRDIHKSITKSSIFSHTVSSSHHFVVFESYKDGLYAARLIDTPGLSEVKPVGSDMEERSDEEIIAEITASLKGISVDKVFLIFALSSSGLNKEDISALKKLKRAFSENQVFDKKIDLVFPRADKTTAKSLRHLIGELTSNFSQWGVNRDDYGDTYLSGSIFNDEFESGYKEAVLGVAPRVFLYRNIILEKIFGTNFLENLVISDPVKNLVGLSPKTRGKIEEIVPARKKRAKMPWDDQ